MNRGYFGPMDDIKFFELADTQVYLHEEVLSPSQRGCLGGRSSSVCPYQARKARLCDNIIGLHMYVHNGNRRMTRACKLAPLRRRQLAIQEGRHERYIDINVVKYDRVILSSSVGGGGSVFGAAGAGFARAVLRYDPWLRAGLVLLYRAAWRSPRRQRLQPDALLEAQLLPRQHPPTLLMVMALSRYEEQRDSSLAQTQVLDQAPPVAHW
ncbi:hypothetical protein QAD02_020070 [Eretmocerus hayati]|uniref:Uncharacterized protein n=1 Tax=Eretmocerus hayati TaxID=131215 RepID=A0ACC2PLG5_9HYME|nr:hypothetical protein QAD02_020070 [Eretmocerus hayati]